MCILYSISVLRVQTNTEGVHVCSYDTAKATEMLSTMENVHIQRTVRVGNI